VYTIVLACAFALAPGAGHAPAQVQLTVTPFMTRGPADAPVTIVEFSDYQ
jgi:protein-disulfide isomerase